MGFEGFIKLVAEIGAPFAPGERRLCVRLADSGSDQAKAQQRTQQTDRQAWHRFFRNPEISVAADNLTATAPLCRPTFSGVFPDCRILFLDCVWPARLTRVGRKWSRFWQNDTRGNKSFSTAIAFHVEKAEFVLP
jgi:hypothetical protein